MKPQKPDVDWCLANRELVMRWLERRGGWQPGDWFYDGLVGGIGLLRFGDDSTYSLDTWLPAIDDVLEMLGQRGIHPSLSANKDGEWSAWAFPPDHYCHADHMETPGIALMELLKSLEEENE